MDGRIRSAVSVVRNSVEVYWAIRGRVEDRVGVDRATPVGQLHGVADQLGARIPSAGIGNDR
jgi:hypothetical protein